MFHAGVNTNSEGHHAVTQLFISDLWIIMSTLAFNMVFVQILNLSTALLTFEYYGKNTGNYVTCSI